LIIIKKTTKTIIIIPKTIQISKRLSLKKNNPKINQIHNKKMYIISLKPYFSLRLIDLYFISSAGDIYF
jgi:hypothetical protein